VIPWGAEAGSGGPAACALCRATALPSRELPPAEPERQTIRDLGVVMGHDFSRVHLHDDAAAHAVTERLGAEAVTIGYDVLFARVA
jgi:hypothetical protein